MHGHREGMDRNKGFCLHDKKKRLTFKIRALPICWNISVRDLKVQKKFSLRTEPGRSAQIYACVARSSTACRHNVECSVLQLGLDVHWSLSLRSRSALSSLASAVTSCWRSFWNNHSSLVVSTWCSCLLPCNMSLSPNRTHFTAHIHEPNKHAIVVHLSL